MATWFTEIPIYRIKNHGMSHSPIDYSMGCCQSYQDVTDLQKLKKNMGM